jgi:hypothetical protein
MYLEQIVADGANVGPQVLASVNSALKLTLRHSGRRRFTMPTTWWTRPSTQDDLWKIYTELNVAVAAFREAEARLKIAGE